MTEITRTEFFLYNYGRILGMCPFDLEGKLLFKFSYLGMFYSLVLCSGFGWNLYKALEYHSGTIMPGETPIAKLANCFSGFLQYSSVFIIWTTIALRQKSLFSIFERFATIRETATKIGNVADERERFFKKLASRIVIVNTALAVYTVINHIQLMLYDEGKDSIHFQIFDISYFVSQNLVIVFINALCLVRDRFAWLNETTRNLDIVAMFETGTKGINGRRERIILLPEKIELVRQLHGGLIELAEMIRDFCSPALLAIMGMHFVQLVTNLYIVWLSILEYKTLDLQDFINFLMVIGWFVVNIMEPFVIVDVCADTCKEASLTPTVLHEMWNERATSSITCSNVVDVVSLSLLRHRLNFTLCGFLDLDPTLVYKFSKITITYMILMMQLDEEEDERRRHLKLRSGHQFHR